MPEQNTLEQLLGIFVDTGKFSERQVRTVFDLSDCDFEKTMECLLEGPTIQGLVRLHQKMFCGKAATKFYIDSDDLWPDMVGYYKTGVNTSKPIKVILDEQPAIDTGGVCRQVFSDVFTLFANNKHFRLFEGEPCSLRPVHSANCQSSGQWLPIQLHRMEWVSRIFHLFHIGTLQLEKSSHCNTLVCQMWERTSQM